MKKHKQILFFCLNDAIFRKSEELSVVRNDIMKYHSEQSPAPSEWGEKERKLLEEIKQLQVVINDVLVL